MMTRRQHHLFDFSSPPNAAAMMSMPSFDHAAGLLSLHDVADDHHHLRGGVLPSPWSPQQVSLSLYNNAAGSPPSSLVAHQQLAAFAAAPAAMHQPFQLRGSKYLGPVKELLSEFCSLEVEGYLLHAMDGAKQQRAPKIGKWDEVEASWGNLSLSSMDILTLEGRKARILSAVEEVDRRYRRYREQMRVVEVSFAAVAGGGAAQVYTKLAMRAMSRHFRCLRDALVGQVRALRKAMGERDAAGAVGGVAAAAPGVTMGDTPRLRALDQCLRQQRAFQQSGVVDNFLWRPQRGLPERAIAVLRAWLFEHFLHPYPNDVDKHILARQTGLSRSQVSNWFINARVRLWKPMIEDMYKEEMKPESSDNIGNNNNKLNPSNGGAGNKQQHGDDKNYTATVASSTAANSLEGQSSSYDLHLRSSGNPNSSFIPAAAASIDHHQAAHDGSHQQFGYSYSSVAGLHGASVSRTLGLHQQQPFAAASTIMQQQSFMVEAAAEEEDEVLPYRNLMESQLLHDFAG